MKSLSLFLAIITVSLLIAATTLYFHHFKTLTLASTTDPPKDPPVVKSQDGGCRVKIGNGYACSIVPVNGLDIGWQTANAVSYKSVSVFCVPTFSPTQMFSWNWCIW